MSFCMNESVACTTVFPDDLRCRMLPLQPASAGAGGSSPAAVPLDASGVIDAPRLGKIPADADDHVALGEPLHFRFGGAVPDERRRRTQHEVEVLQFGLHAIDFRIRTDRQLGNPSAKTEMQSP
jgi:hypothetical protein